ncbi:MAG: hypothetical protein ACRC4M_00190 [Mycoplasma sp.]
MKDFIKNLLIESNNKLIEFSNSFSVSSRNINTNDMTHHISNERTLASVISNSFYDSLCENDKVCNIVYINESKIESSLENHESILKNILKEYNLNKCTKKWKHMYPDTFLYFTYKDALYKLYIEYKLTNVFNPVDLLVDLSKFRLYTYNENNVYFLYVNINKEKSSIFHKFDNEKNENLLIDLNEKFQNNDNESLKVHDFSNDDYNNYIFLKDDMGEEMEIEDLSKTHILSSEINVIETSIEKDYEEKLLWYYLTNKLGSGVVPAKILKKNYFMINSIYEKIKDPSFNELAEMSDKIKWIENLKYTNLLEEYNKLKIFFNNFINDNFKKAKIDAISNLISPSYEKSKLILIWLMRFNKMWKFCPDKWETNNLFEKYNENTKKKESLTEFEIEENISGIFRIIENELKDDEFWKISIMLLTLIINVYKENYDYDGVELNEKDFIKDKRCSKKQKKLFDSLYKHGTNKKSVPKIAYDEDEVVYNCIEKCCKKKI